MVRSPIFSPNYFSIEELQQTWICNRGLATLMSEEYQGHATEQDLHRPMEANFNRLHAGRISFNFLSVISIQSPTRCRHQLEMIWYPDRGFSEWRSRGDLVGKLMWQKQVSHLWLTLRCDFLVSWLLTLYLSSLLACGFLGPLSTA